jgi:prepilin signal peptidase PulO-like enzyme (type II secretory pathway)
MIVPALFILLGGYASWVDSREYRIPDETVILGLLCVVGLCFAEILSWRSSLGGFALAGGQMGLVKILVQDRFGWGDVKYALFLGGMLGPGAWMTALLFSVIGALMFFLAETTESRENLKGKLPFAPFLTAGGIAAFLTGWSML